MTIEEAYIKCLAGYCIMLPHWHRNVAKEVQHMAFIDKSDKLVKKNVLYRGIPLPEKLTKEEMASKDWMVCPCDPKVWRRVT